MVVGKRRIKDLSGHVLGRLTVLSFVSLDERNEALWLCKCECGKEKTISSGNLKMGVKSCGCLRDEKVKDRFTKHGHCREYVVSSEYSAWQSMIARCYKKNHESYKNYGGRGIRVCDRWLESFENFIEDMGMKPSPELSLDRFPNNETGNYELSNCRWGTNEQQNTNRRNNRRIEYNGDVKTVSQWAKIFNIKFNTLRERLELGWSIKDALEKPLICIESGRGKKNLILYKGVEQSTRKWCMELGLEYATIGHRLRIGWPPEKAFETPNLRPKRKAS
jgi:hypothetical protein